MTRSIVRSAPLIGFRKTVLELGGDPEKILKKVRLSPLVLDDPELIIPHESFLKLINIAAADTGCDYFGLLLSKHLDISVLGTLGLLMQHSDTVEEALSSLVRYYATQFQGAELELKIEGDFTYFYFRIKKAHEDTRQNVYLAAGIGIKLMHFLCGKEWKPVEIQSTYKQPENASFHDRFLGVPIRYGQEETRMIINTSDLKKKIAGNFVPLKRYIQPHIDAIETKLPNDIVTSTEYLIRTLLTGGGCNIENISSQLSTNERGLQRALKSKGTSFRQLVEKVRKSIAHQQLLHSDLSNSQLAYVLGYTELSTFTRAFKRWFGMAPSKWKSQKLAK